MLMTSMFSLSVKGCRMNGTLYPFGERMRDGCTVYECQNRDNCGRFIPIEWGKLITEQQRWITKYLPSNGQKIIFFFSLYMLFAGFSPKFFSCVDLKLEL